MPPKKKASKTNDLVEETTDIGENSEKDVVDIATLQRDLIALFDRRFKEQTDHINNLFSKLSKSTKSDLDEIRKSQEFLGTKFDELAVSINEVKTENAKLKKDNAELQQRVSLLQKQENAAMTDIENLRRYSRRDTLEIQGIPVVSGENTNAIVLKVVQLVMPESKFDESIISVSHRLRSPRGNLPPAIIVKFVRRDVRDMIYMNRRNLGTKSTRDLGLSESNKIYVNESLTPQSRAVLIEAKKFRSQHRFKFIWTRNGRVFLKQDENQSACAFDSLQEFVDFKTRYESYS